MYQLCAYRVSSASFNCRDVFVQELVLQEANVMKRQRHPNIMELHAAFVSDHFLWMVLPFVSGGSLEVLLKRGYPKVSFLPPYWRT